MTAPAGQRRSGRRLAPLPVRDWAKAREKLRAQDLETQAAEAGEPAVPTMPTQTEATLNTPPQHGSPAKQHDTLNGITQDTPPTTDDSTRTDTPETSEATAQTTLTHGHPTGSPPPQCTTAWIHRCTTHGNPLRMEVTNLTARLASLESTIASFITTITTQHQAAEERHEDLDGVIRERALAVLPDIHTAIAQ